MADEFDGKHGSLDVYPFYTTDAVTAQTGTVMLSRQAGISTVVMPKSGSVVGISVKTSADLTAGNVSFGAHKAGTALGNTPAPALTSAAGNSGASYVTLRPRVCTFSAGDSLGVYYTSDADAAPTDNNDYVASLWVMYDKD